MKLSKIGLILSLSYLALFLASVGYALYLLVFQTETSEFSGLPAIMITAPWSLLAAPLFDSLGVIQWYEQFADSPLIYGLCATGILVPGALFNAALLYFLGALIERMIPKKDAVKKTIAVILLMLWTVPSHASITNIPVQSGIELQPGESKTVTIASDAALEVGWKAVQKPRCTMHCVEAVDKSGGHDLSIATDIGASTQYTPRDGNIIIEYRNKADHPVTIDIHKVERVCDAEACAFLKGNEDGHWLVYKIGQFTSIETSKDKSYSTISGATAAGKPFTVKVVWWTDNNNGLFQCYQWMERYINEHVPASEYAPYILSGKTLGEDKTVLQSVDTCAPKAPNFGVPEENVY